MKKMGNSESQYIDKLSDDDDLYYDFPDERKNKEPGSILKRGLDLTTDAAPRSSITLPAPESTLNLDQISQIENQLDEDEIVSLVYLLFDDNHYALQELRLRLQDSSRRLLHEWARREEKLRHSWHKKTIEALCIIQNYKLLRELGYLKQHLIDHYLPHQPNTSLHVHKMRKICYILCEKMNNKKTTQFIEMFKKDLRKKGIDLSHLNYIYLEMYLLELEILKYIDRNNLTNLEKILKVMDDDELNNVVEDNMLDQNGEIINTELHLQNTNVITKDNKPSLTLGIESFQSSGNYGELQNRTPSVEITNQKPSTSMDNFRVVEPTAFTYNLPPSIQNQPSSSIGKYSVDPNNPGVVLIINQQDFYTEFQEDFKHLLPQDTTNKLEPRTGTEKDRDDLKNTFTKFGFKVIVKEDLTHFEMLSTIKETLSNITKESSLFICILSHGDKGIVYGSNSCKVKVSRIQRLMCKTNKSNLQGKPKILILQSCQGQQCQKINDSSSDDNDSSDSDSSSLTTDNSTSRQSLPTTADMFTFWATVRGYAAVRHKKTGSWFIQAICKQMEDLGNQLHFADICTSVIDEVTKKKWSTPEGDVNVTNPIVVNTLRYPFFLPPMKT